MSVSDSLNPSRRNGPFSRVGVSMNCSWAVSSAERAARAQMASSVGSDEVEGGDRTGRELDVADLGHHVGGTEHLARVVDLEVAEAQVVEGREGLGSGSFEVRVAQVGGLRAPGGRHRAVGVEQVAGVHGDEPPGLALVEGHRRGGRHHRPEVGHVGAVGQAGQRTGPPAASVTIRVRLSTRWVQGATGGRPITWAVAQAAASKPGRSQPSGAC